MKRYILVGLLFSLATLSYAIDRSKTISSSDFTGDQIEFSKVGVSSSAATALNAYSSSRGALTCINTDQTFSVWLGSSSLYTAGGAYTFQLNAGQAIQFRTNAAIYGLASVGVSSTTVYCIKEY